MNQCSICKCKFHTSELLQSNQDDYFCKQCFKYEYCTCRQLCTKKKSMLPNKCEGDATTKPKKMFTLDELLMIQKNRDRKNRFFTSKRPLQCPHVECNRYVSVFDLNAHFQHEHIEVKIAQTMLDMRNPLTFYPKEIRYGVKQCLVLFNVIPIVNEEKNANGSQSEKSMVPVTVAVLASRLAPAQLGNESIHDCLLDDDESNEPIVCTNDKIMIWTASNVICNYNYTVAVSTISEDVRVKYYGPVLQLGNSNKKLCMEGHGLILSHYHFRGMSENGTKPLHLDVIIHSED